MPSKCRQISLDVEVCSLFGRFTVTDQWSPHHNLFLHLTIFESSTRERMFSLDHILPKGILNSFVLRYGF